MVGAMAEEAPRGGVDAIGAAAEIDAIQIELEDLVLGELALERQRQHALLDFAPEGAAVGQEDVARELLGDGRSALAPVTGVEANLERAGDPDRVDSEVTAETLVL